MKNITEEQLTAVAKLRGCRMSARKMRLVADIVRGLDAEKALATLRYTRREGAIWIDKLLLSAMANWSVLTGEDAADYELKLASIQVDQGAQLKRFRPAPHGRAHRIRKHTCHVTLTVVNQKALDLSSTEDNSVLSEDTVDLEEIQ